MSFLRELACASDPSPRALAPDMGCSTTPALAPSAPAHQLRHCHFINYSERL